MFKVMYKNRVEIYIYIYTIVCFQFYKYIGLNIAVTKFLLFAIIPLMFGICWKTIMLRHQSPLFRLMRWILFSTAFSMVSAWVFREQPLMLSYRISAYLFVFLFFFYLCKVKPSLKFLENYILILGLLYVVLWLFAFSQLPNRVFYGGGEEDLIEDVSRGIERINFTGRLSMILAYFLCLVRFSLTKKRIWLYATFFFFVFLVLQLTRQLILWTALATVIYIYSFSKKYFFIGLIIVLSGGIFLKNVRLSEDTVIGAMIALTEAQAKNNNYKSDEDIRITAYKFYMGDFSKNAVTDVIGNGMPHADSSYGKSHILAQNKGLYLSDVGYAKIYVINGIIGLLLYLMLFVFSLRKKIPQNLAYAQLFIIFLIPANIAAGWYSTPDCQIALSTCIYLIMRYSITNRSKGKLIIELENTTF